MSDLTKIGKKVFTWSVVLTTIIWSVGFLALPISVAAVGSGDLIKKADSASLYYLGADNKRYVFPSDRVFFTWYDDFSDVQTLSDTEVESYALGDNVTAKPGVKLVQAVTNDTPWQVADPKVYAVAANGTLRHITSAAVAEELYGADWETMILPVVETVFVGYNSGDDVTAAGDFDKDAETATATSINVDKGLSEAEGGTVLTVALAADTPSSGIVVQSAARFPFTTITLAASADGDITIDSLTVERTGTVAQDAPFDTIALIDDTDTSIGDGDQIGLNKSLNANHKAVFNDDITVSAGATKKITLAANMDTSGLSSYAGEIPSLSLAAVSLKGGATLSGTLPITGNYQTVNGTVTVASGTLGTGPSNPSTDAAPEIGKENVNFTEIKITNSASSTTNPSGLKIRQIKWTNYGSVADGDVENIDLVDQDGTVLATLDSMTDKKAIHRFAAGSEPTIDAGQNRSYMIRGDTTGGSARTVDMSIKYYTDILVWDSDHNVYITLTAGTGASSSTPYIDGTAHTVGNGSLKIEPATLAAANVAEGTTQQVLGAFKFTVKGESIDITSIGWKTTLTGAAGSVATTSDITNLTIYDPDGNVVAGPSDPTHDAGTNTTAYGAATTTDTITVPVGENVYTVKGDLSTDFTNDDTIVLSVWPHLATMTGNVSGNSITATPSTEQSSATMTLKTAAFDVRVSSSPAAQTVVRGTNDFEVANIVIDTTDSGEGIKISQIKATVHAGTKISGGSAFTANQLSNFRLFDGAAQLDVSNDPDSGLSSTANTNSTSTFTLSNSLVIDKGVVKTLTVKVNVGTSATDAGTFAVGVGADNSTGTNITSISAVGASTGNTVYGTYDQGNGQTMTVTTAGILKMYTAGSNPPTGLLISNTTGNTIGVVTAEAEYEDIKITDLGFRVVNTTGTNTYDDISLLTLTDGTNSWSVDVNSATATISPPDASPLIIPAGGEKTLTIKADTPEVGTDKVGDSGDAFYVQIETTGNVEAQGQSSGSTSITKTNTTFDLNSMYLYKTKPTVTQVALSGMAIGTGKDLYKFTVAADSAGDVGFYKATFDVTTTSATVTNFKLYECDTSACSSLTEISSASMESTAYEVITASSGGQGGTYRINTTFDTSGVTPTDLEWRSIPAGSSKTYLLRGDVTRLAGITNSNISIAMIGDDAQPKITPNLNQVIDTANDIDSEDNDSFIWSDLFYGSNSTSATTSMEWTNGYKIISTTTQSFSF